jgi:hypothetical protein
MCCWQIVPSRGHTDTTAQAVPRPKAALVNPDVRKDRDPISEAVLERLIWIPNQVQWKHVDSGNSDKTSPVISRASRKLPYVYNNAVVPLACLDCPEEISERFCLVLPPFETHSTGGIA